MPAKLKPAVTVSAAAWRKAVPGLATLARRVAAAAHAAAQADGAAALAGETAILFARDADIQPLNAQYRGKDKPTNVLSFPMLAPDEFDALANTDDGEVLLGDIILAAETCAAEAAAKDWAMPAYAQHLIVHGTLHLLGYDHELGETEAFEMEALESSACRALGLPDPYEG